MTAKADLQVPTQLVSASGIGTGRIILHVVTRHVPYGAARNLHFSLELERRIGYEVHLAVGGDTKFPVPAGVHTHQVPYLQREVSPWADVRALRATMQLVERLQPDVVVTHKSKAGVLGRYAARHVAPVLIHFIHMPSFGPGYSPAASWAFLTIERRCAAFTDFFVAVGDELKQRYLAAKVGSEEQYEVIRSPMDFTHFLKLRHDGQGQRLAWRTSLGIPEHAYVICAAGLMERRKRFDLMIDRLAPLIRTGGAVMVMAGDGPEAPRLKEHVARLGLDRAVIFLGYVSEVHRMFAASDLLVHASTTEGVPQVVLQAFAVGIPVVATDAVGLREIPGGHVTIVDASGSGMLGACELVLAGPKPIAVSPEAFEPWTPHVVADQLTNLHRRVGVILQDRRPK